MNFKDLQRSQGFQRSYFRGQDLKVFLIFIFLVFLVSGVRVKNGINNLIKMYILNKTRLKV